MNQTNSIGTPSDYSEDLYRVYFEIGDHDFIGKNVIVSFLVERSNDIPSLSFNPNSLVAREHGYEIDIPNQIIPEIVRELSRENVAVYQVVRIAKIQKGG